MVDFKIGQVLNFRSSSFFSRSIQIGLGHYWNHTGWIVDIKGDTIFIQEALGSKTKKVSTNPYSKEWLVNKFKNNELKIMDWGIINDARFQTCVKDIENKPYDYFTIFELFLTRVFSIIGLTSLSKKWTSFSFFKRFLKYLKKQTSNNKYLDCSEAISRQIFKLTGIHIPTYAKVSDFDFVTPQDVSVVYDRLMAVKNRGLR